MSGSKESARGGGNSFGAQPIRSGRHGIHPERDANYGLTKYCYGRATAYVANNKRPAIAAPRAFGNDDARDENKYLPPYRAFYFARKLRNAAEHGTGIAASLLRARGRCVASGAIVSLESP